MRGAVAGLLLCVVTTACENGEDDVAAADAAPAVDLAEPAAIAPLTGLCVEDEALLERPVVAVEVDNAPAARPQRGLGDADIVFVHPVEGGITRLLALYHSALPEEVGPVRSGREVHAELLPSYEPVFAYSGVAPGLHPRFREMSAVLREEAQPLDAWTRDAARRAPHNLFVSPEVLLAESPSGPPPARPWPIDAGLEPSLEEGAANGDEVGRVTLSHAVDEVVWSWEESAEQGSAGAGEGDRRAEAGRWARSQGGERHVTEDGGVVHAANVVVMRVETRETARTDSAGHPVAVPIVTGRGEALVLSGGRAIPARWQREPGEHFRWERPDGEPLQLRPGPTWIELVPVGSSVETSAVAVG